ncbi:MAG: RHS repeat-associated core domain-containing protein [Bacteroidota bacterium]
MILKAGFHAKAGTNFVAKIADCPQSGFETDGFVERSTDDYLYDQNGNQTRDPNKGITNQYNYFNLAYKTTFDNGNVLEWLYLGDGTKVQKVAKRGGVIVSKQDYFSSIEYRNDTLDGIYLEDAKLTFNGGAFDKHVFYIKDYIANSRVLFADDGTGQAEIVQNQDFYPYGYQLKGNYTQNLNPTDKYQFNGFERTTDFGLGIDIAPVRSYDPTTGRWWQVDPKAEHPRLLAHSPYHFSVSNPIRFNDPDGDCPPWICGAIAGGLLEVGTQLAVNLAKGQSLSESVRNIDLADVGAAALEGGISGGASVARRLLIKGGAMVVSEAFQNSVDIKISGDRDIIGVGDSKKTVGKVALNTAIGVSAGAIGTTVETVGTVIKNTADGATDAAIKKVNRELQPSRSISGSEGQATRLSQKAALEATQQVNSTVAGAVGTTVTETIEDKTKIE